MRSHIAANKSVKATCRPAASSWRARSADMSRAGFIELGTGWSGVLVLVFFVSALVRFVD
jgi:hypothetical protein